jgi:hypothetical protein
MEALLPPLEPLGEELWFVLSLVSCCVVLWGFVLCCVVLCCVVLCVLCCLVPSYLVSCLALRYVVLCFVVCCLDVRQVYLSTLK